MSLSLTLTQLPPRDGHSGQVGGVSSNLPAQGDPATAAIDLMVLASNLVLDIPDEYIESALASEAELILPTFPAEESMWAGNAPAEVGESPILEQLGPSVSSTELREPVTIPMDLDPPHPPTVELIQLHGRSASHADAAAAGQQASFKPRRQLLAPNKPIYARPSDWESKKSVLENLYLVEGLNLIDVMRLMKQRHRFHATTKMYKTQFTKWKWRKYRKEGAVDDCRRKSCYRSEHSRAKALHHEGMMARLLAEALETLRDFMLVFIKRDPGWKTFSKFRLLGPTAWDEPAISDDIGTALDRFDHGQVTIGGTYLRYAFFRMEDVLLNINVYDGFDLIIEAVRNIIWSDRDDILTAYLSHLGTMAATTASQHPIGRIATLLGDVSRLSKTQLRHFVSAAFEFRADVWAERRGNQDRSTLDAREKCHRAKKELGIDTYQAEWAMQELTKQYDLLIREAIEQQNGDDDAVLLLEDDVLIMQCNAGISMEDFVERSTRLLEAISTKYELKSLPTSDWDSFHIKIYINCLVRLIGRLLDVGDVDRAIQQLPKYPTVFELDWDLDYHYLGESLCVEDFLRDLGRTGEADELWQVRDDSKRLQSIVSILQQFEEMEI